MHSPSKKTEYFKVAYPLGFPIALQHVLLRDTGGTRVVQHTGHSNAGSSDDPRSCPNGCTLKQFLQTSLQPRGTGNVGSYPSDNCSLNCRLTKGGQCGSAGEISRIPDGKLETLRSKHVAPGLRERSKMRISFLTYAEAARGVQNERGPLARTATAPCVRAMSARIFSAAIGDSAH